MWVVLGEIACYDFNFRLGISDGIVRSIQGRRLERID